MPKMGEGHFSLVYVGDGAGHYIKCPVLTTTQRDALTGVEGMIIFNSTTDQLEEYDGSTWEAVGQVIMTTHEADFELHKKVVRKTADQTVNNSTTLVNDDELLFAVAANEVWVFRVYLLVATGGTPDIDFSFSCPSGATVRWCLGSDSVREFAAGTEMYWAGALTKGFGELLGIVINGSTAGNLQLQWTQNVANVSDTKVLTDSCIIATQVV